MGQIPSYVPADLAAKYCQRWPARYLESLPPELPPGISPENFKGFMHDLLYREKTPGEAMPDNIALHANPYPARVEIPDGLNICNAHCHASGFGLDIVDIGDGPKIVPFAPNRNYNAWPFPHDELNTYNEQLGMTGGAVVVGQTVYRYNNDYLVHTLQQNPHMMGVASVATDASEELIHYLHAQRAISFRFTGVGRLQDKDDPFDIDQVAAFDERVAGYGLPGASMNLYLEASDLAKYEAQILAMKLPVRLDHLAIPDVFEFREHGEKSLEILRRVLEKDNGDDSLRNMVKGFGPERIIMSNMGANAPAHIRRQLLDGDFDLSESVTVALRGNEPLSPKIRGELAVNPRIWHCYVLPLASFLARKYSSQLMFGTDAQHPNTTVPVDDGQLIMFALKATDGGGSPERAAKIRSPVFFRNAVDAYPGNDFESAPGFNGPQFESGMAPDSLHNNLNM